MMVANWGDPPCRHTQPVSGCVYCTQWLHMPAELRLKVEELARAKLPDHYAESTPGKRTRAEEYYDRVRGSKPPKPDDFPNRKVNHPTRAERISLPVRPPCKYEGKVTSFCHACNENFKVRHCEHDNADWDFCARTATPRDHGQNCQTCPLYTPPGT